LAEPEGLVREVIYPIAGEATLEQLIEHLGVVKKQLHTFQVEYYLTPRVELLNLCPNDQCTNANVQFAKHQQSIRLKNFMLR
jgi:hypothetical protein